MTATTLQLLRPYEQRAVWLPVAGQVSSSSGVRGAELEQMLPL